MNNVTDLVFTNADKAAKEFCDWFKIMEWQYTTPPKYSHPWKKKDWSSFYPTRQWIKNRLLEFRQRLVDKTSVNILSTGDSYMQVLKTSDNRYIYRFKPEREIEIANKRRA